MQTNTWTHAHAMSARLQQRLNTAHGTTVVLTHTIYANPQTCIHMRSATIAHLQQLPQLPVHLLSAVLCQQAGTEGSILTVTSLRVMQLPQDDGHQLLAQGLQATLQVLCSLCKIPCSQYPGGSGFPRHIWPGS